MKITEKMQIEVTARSRALRVLEGLESRPVQEVLNAELSKAASSDPHERALCTEFVYGVLRNEERLDFLLNLFLGNPRKTAPKLRRVLRLGLYALLHMDRTPAAVSVDACVHLAREACGQPLSRVANGVLRGFLRSEWAGMDAEQHFAALENAAGGGQHGLAVAAGIPEWIVNLWDAGYGHTKTRVLAQAANATPNTCLRINAAREGAKALHNQLLEHGETVGSWGVHMSPGTHPDKLAALAREGRLSRQGAGSLLLLEAMLPHMRGRVWDGCAGFGGKTLALMERGVDVILASDTHRVRLEGLRREAVRVGVTPPQVVLTSATQPPLKVGSVDTILLDVPCSGLGTLARRPDLRRQRRPEHLPSLQTLQADMLRAAWALLESGGTLIYATCALNPDENERQVARFLEETSQARLLLEYNPEPDGFGSDVLYGAAIRKEC